MPGKCLRHFGNDLRRRWNRYTCAERFVVLAEFLSRPSAPEITRRVRGHIAFNVFLCFCLGAIGLSIVLRGALVRGALLQGAPQGDCKCACALPPRGRRGTSVPRRHARLEFERLFSGLLGVANTPRISLKHPPLSVTLIVSNEWWVGSYFGDFVFQRGRRFTPK